MQLNEVWDDSILAERRGVGLNVVQERARSVTLIGSADLEK